MKDRDLTRLLQHDPDAGLQAAMQAYASLVKVVLLRILPRDPQDVEECMADTFVALWRHAADWVGALVAAMDPPDREIFLRKYYLLQTSKEIAAALHLSEGTVNTRLSRGRERLRRQLQQKGVNCHA